MYGRKKTALRCCRVAFGATLVGLVDPLRLLLLIVTPSSASRVGRG